MCRADAGREAGRETEMNGEAADRERRFCLRSLRAHRRRFLIYLSLLSAPSDEFSLMKRLQRLANAVHATPCNMYHISQLQDKRKC